MRVLMITQKVADADLRLGFVAGWVRALAARVARLTVICQEYGPTRLPANVAVISLGKERGQGRAEQLAAFYQAARRAVPRSDVIFCHMIPRYAWLIAPLARWYRVPAALWYTHRSASAELRLAAALVDRVVTAAPDSFPLPGAKVAAIGHGIDADLFSPADPPAEATPPQVVMAARLSPSKYHRTMIQAAARLRARNELGGATFVIVGDEPAESPGYRAGLEAEIARLGLTDCFSFAGAAPYAAMPGHYRRAAAALNLSQPGHFDKAALEAMLCARPVIVANPAYADLLGAHAGALLIDGPEDAEGLATRLAALLAAGPASRARIGMGLYRAARAAHSLDGLMDRLAAIFSEMSRISRQG